MANPFKSILNWVAKHFQDDPAKMLIWTGVAGWSISSAAQIFAIIANPKIDNEKKGFLIPQEMYDAVTNISLYFLITLFAKKTVSKLFTTGKWAPKNVRKFLNENKSIYSDKIGKVNFDLGKELDTPKRQDLLKEYDITKSFGTTVATVGAGVLATNILTPIVRNKMASRIQKTYIDIKNEMKENPTEQVQKQPAFKSNFYAKYNSSSLKI
jgi:hypothetical protein